MGRAKHEAYRKASGEVNPRPLAEGETLESAPATAGIAETPIAEFAPGLDGNMRRKAFPDQEPATIETAHKPDEIRKASVDSMMHRPLEAGYVHPEERNSPEYRREQERRNLAAARPSWGLDAQAKIVNPSPNMGQRKVKVLW